MVTLKPTFSLKSLLSGMAVATTAFVSPAFAQQVPAQTVSLSQEQVQTLDQAQQAYEKRQYDQALNLSNAILSVNAQQDRALFIRASARVEKGIETGNPAIVRDGVADARKAIEISQSANAEYYLPYLYGMTNLSLLENRTEHAETSVNIATQIIDKLEMSAQNKASMLYQRGLAKLQLEDTIEPAVADFKQAIALEPKHIASLTALADAYAMAEQNENAMQAFDLFITTFPEHPIGYNNRGMFHKQLDNKQAAIADFAKATELQPKFFVAHINLGYTNMEAGNIAAAQKAFNDAIALQPENPSVYALRANTYLRQGNSQAAIADYQKAIELFPKNPMAHADLGFAHFFLKDYATAFTHFDQAININGKLRFLDPWIYASMVLSGQVQEANNRFAGTVAKPDEERDWIDLATLYLMGKIDQAVLLSKVNKEDPVAGKAQTCEGNYFVGLRVSNTDGAEQAAPFFRAALATDAKQLSAYRATQFELKQFQQ